jgi:N-terminal domain of oxidoreductase
MINQAHGWEDIRMAAGVNRQILLVEKPVGKLGPEHFRVVEAAIPEPKDGEALLRVRLISLDAANRAWMHGATYRAALETNAVMAGGGVAEVVESKAPGLAAGDLVFGDTGWQDYVAAPGKHLSKLPRVEPMSHLLSIYGIAGLTAYFGLLDVGRPQTGERSILLRRAIDEDDRRAALHLFMRVFTQQENGNDQSAGCEERRHEEEISMPHGFAFILGFSPAGGQRTTNVGAATDRAIPVPRADRTREHSR